MALRIYDNGKFQGYAVKGVSERNYVTEIEARIVGMKDSDISIMLDSDTIDKIIDVWQKRYPHSSKWLTQKQREKLSKEQ